MVRSNKLKAILLSVILCISICPDIVWADYSSNVESFQYNGIEIPESNDNAYVVVNENNPTFSETEKASSETYELYSQLDELNRVGPAQANIDKSSLDVDPRGNISSIMPTGWIQNKYDIVSGGWIYNRSHLYAHSLGGDDITENLMTGTRAFNVDGMYATSESLVLNYIKTSVENVHILYRVSPVFNETDLLAKGVLIEAQCLENPEFKICIFCYNTQPGIMIDYETGNNKLSEKETDDQANNHADDSKEAFINIKETNPKCHKKYVYTGKPLIPTIDFTNSVLLPLNQNDYNTDYKNNIMPGKATITIKGIGQYFGSTTLNFIIIPKQIRIIKASGSRKSLTLTWKKHPGITGYQIAFRRKGTSKFRYITCKSTTTKKMIRALKTGRKYQIKIRAYKQINGKKHFGTYSTIKTVSIE